MFVFFFFPPSRSALLYILSNFSPYGLHLSSNLRNDSCSLTFTSAQSSICFLISINKIYFLRTVLIPVLTLTLPFVCFSIPWLNSVIVASVVLFTFSAWVAVLQMQSVKAVLFCERKEPFGKRTMGLLDFFFFLFLFVFFTQGWRFSAGERNLIHHLTLKPSQPHSPPPPLHLNLFS